MLGVLFLLQLAVAARLSLADEADVDKMLPGSVVGIYSKKPEVQSVAKFAVTHGVNAIDSKDVSDMTVVRATAQTVAGIKYGLTIKATNLNNECLLIKALVFQDLTGEYQILEKHTNPDCTAVKTTIRDEDLPESESEERLATATAADADADTPAEPQPNDNTRHLRAMTSKAVPPPPPSAATPPVSRKLRAASPSTKM